MGKWNIWAENVVRAGACAAAAAKTPRVLIGRNAPRIWVFCTHADAASFRVDSQNHLWPYTRITLWADASLLRPALGSTFLAAIAQQAVLAVWAVFGAGRWPVRFALIIGASAACYALVETQLLRGFNDWRIAAQGIAVIPLRLAGMALPLAAWQIWSGRRLMHSVDFSARHSIAAARRRFAIRDLLGVTAYVAIAIALIRWTKVVGVDNQRSEVTIACLSLITSAWTTIYVTPLAWGLLARQGVIWDS